jgi:hypothetical protein
MRNILLAVAATGLIGCVGGIETSTPSPSPIPTTPPPDGVGGGGSGPAAIEARNLFETNVYPILVDKCIDCHSSSGAVGNITGFVAPTKADAYVTAASYAAVMGDRTPGGAPVLAKVVAGHQQKTYSQTEKDAITAWLTKELEARSGPPPVTPPGESPAELTVRLTKEWSGCMTLANFNAADMKAFGTMRANNSNCETCHVNGEYGEIASRVPGPFFEVISTNKYYMAMYFSVDLPNKKMIINTRSFTGVGQALPPHTEHPRFNFAGSTGEIALKKFYDLTMAAKALPAGAAGACGPATLKN